jgi:hypothetical protein
MHWSKLENCKHILSAGIGKNKIITGGDSAMGEKTEFEPGDKAPNDGQYMEVGERSFHMGIENPKIITLKKGDSFPETTNDDRKWKKKNK